MLVNKEKIIEKLHDVRFLMDGIMYDGDEVLEDDEYLKLRECYDHICNVIDVLYNMR